MEGTRKHFKKRDAILECLMSTTAHPSADMVHEMLQNEHPDISLATVYRNLALFKKQGRIISVGTVNGTERFDANTAPHVHFVCNGCDAVLDLHELEIPGWFNKEAERVGNCRVTGCQVTFTGLCTVCQNTLANQN